ETTINRPPNPPDAAPATPSPTSSLASTPRGSPPCGHGGGRRPSYDPQARSRIVAGARREPTCEHVSTAVVVADRQATGGPPVELAEVLTHALKGRLQGLEPVARLAT